MRPSEVTVEFLQDIDYTIKNCFFGESTIDGVLVKPLKPIVDGRGDVIELWSAPWMQDADLVQPQHVYQSATDYGVTKCWHLHEIHTDQFTVTRGKLQVVCVDIRPESATFGHVNSFVTGTQSPQLIKIPPGVMHGWKALAQPETIVVNLQSHPYDPADEFKFAWDCVLKEVWQPQNG